MKENIDDIYADIATQYGNTQLQDNITFILSLYEARLKDDGTIDDKIQVPSAVSYTHLTLPTNSRV